MNIAGKFSKVSNTTYRDGVVLVGFCGDAYPHDLSKENIEHIKEFYNMPGCKHQFLNEWPDSIKPAYDAVKRNFKNGFILIER